MGKTLKRQRARAAAESAGLALRPVKQFKDTPANAKASAAAAAAAAAATPVSKLSFLVSDALQKRDWQTAIKHLKDMTAAGRPPKLGAVQRFIRDADCAGDEAVAAQLICAVLRAASCGAVGAGGAKQGGSGSNSGEATPAPAAPAGSHPPVRRFPAWCPPLDPAAAAAGGDSQQQQQDPEPAAPVQPAAAPQSAPMFFEVQRAPGAGGADSFVTGAPVPIFSYPPGAAVTYAPAHPPPTRVNVPHVPGAFVIVNALSQGECRQLLAAGRALGFTREVDYSFGSQHGAGVGPGTVGAAAAAAAAAAATPKASAAAPGLSGISVFDVQQAATSAARVTAAKEAGLSPVAGRPAEGCVWMVDESVMKPLYARVVALLPQQLGGGVLAGINPRWRLYRYTPGAVYRPHGELVLVLGDRRSVTGGLAASTGQDPPSLAPS